MRNKRRILLGFAALLLAITAALCLWYSRPLTVEELCPGVELDRCVGANIYFSTYADKTLENRIELSPDDHQLPRLLELFQGRTFSRSPLWWFPSGTRTHPWRDGDFRWSIDLSFQDASVPGSSTAAGNLLHFNNFFGELEMRFMGETRPVSTADQEHWLEEVLDIIQTSEPNSKS